MSLLALEGFATRRLAGEPVARILGEQGFFGLRFGLNAATLVPRPETERLVEFGLEALAPHEAPRILDLGTGSGCIAVSLLAHHRGARATGIDLSPEAIDMAARNAGFHGVGSRLTLLTGDWFEPLPVSSRFDLVVSNPPYVVREVIAGLQPEVRGFDPALALDGGADGLEAYRRIAERAGAFLSPGGLLLLEIGHDQGEAVPALLAAHGYGSIRVETDLSGLDRVVLAHHVQP